MATVSPKTGSMSPLYSSISQVTLSAFSNLAPEEPTEKTVPPAPPSTPVLRAVEPMGVDSGPLNVALELLSSSP